MPCAVNFCVLTALGTWSCSQGKGKWYVLPLAFYRSIAYIFSWQRLAKWFTTLSPRDKAKIIKDVSQLVLARRTRMCNFLEYKGMCNHEKAYISGLRVDKIQR